MDLVIAEDSHTSSLETLTHQLEFYRTEVKNIQRELDQALSVWRAILAQEKEETRALLEQKEAAWAKQEGDWEAQRSIYEQKIQDLETHFQNKVKTTEQNALRALNELDDAWQRDKALWHQTVNQRLTEVAEREERWAEEYRNQQTTISQLQQENSQFQTRLAEAHQDHEQQRQQLLAHVDMLEGQVRLMQELIQQILSAPPPHPLRRKTDFNARRRDDEITRFFRA